MSIVLTAMQPLVNMYEKERLDKFEILFSKYGAHDLFMKQSMESDAILSKANRTNAENSYGNVSKVPVIDGIGVTIGNTRSCTIADAENTSHLITLNFTPFTWGFTMYPAQYATGPQAMNYVGYDADFLHKADECTLALMSAVDTVARNTIETNRNTYWPANIITSYYPVLGDAFQISQAQKDDAFNQLSAIMEEFDFYNTTNILGSTSLTPMVQRLSNQRAGNAVNQSFQFNLGDFEFTKSNRVTNGNNVQATMYAIQDGSLSIVNRNNPAARGHMKVGYNGNYGLEWGTMMYPKLGMEVGTFYKEECAVSGGAVVDNATLKESFGFDTEICWLTSYNSSPSTKQTPIIKLEVSQS